MDAPVTVIGEALIDIVVSPAGEAAEHVGGSPANVAIGLARLGHRTELATDIGTDDRGQRISRLMAAEHVELTDGSTTARRTPTATANLDTAGVASYHFELDWQLAPLAVAAGNHLHTGSIAATLQPGGAAVRSIVEAARDQSTVSYDPNARPTLMGSPAEALAVMEPLVALSDVVKASDEDLAWLFGDAAEPGDVLTAWQRLGPAVCVVTRGGSDVLVRVGASTHRVPTHPTTVVDTVGAGDSFMAGLLSGLLDAGLLGGTGARERLRAATWPQVRPAVDRALRCASITVARAGANPPTRRDLQLASTLG